MQVLENTRKRFKRGLMGHVDKNTRVPASQRNILSAVWLSGKRGCSITRDGRQGVPTVPVNIAHRGSRSIVATS